MEVDEAIELLKEMKENCIDKGKTYYEDDKRVKKAQAIETVLKDREKWKRLAETNLKDSEEFKNNMCEHRCLLKSELDNSINKDKIKAKIEEYKNSILENLDEERRWCDIELVDNFEALEKELLEVYK